MKTFKINNTVIEFDETLQYMEFFLQNTVPTLFNFNWKAVLKDLETDEIGWNTETIQGFKFLSRWIHEAPRKRNYRKLALAGTKILSPEEFFLEEDGAEIIDALERTGKLAAEVLKAYGLEPVGPITNADPFKPVTIDEVLKDGN